MNIKKKPNRNLAQHFKMYRSGKTNILQQMTVLYNNRASLYFWYKIEFYIIRFLLWTGSMDMHHIV